jgi:hypothetical protein
MLTGAIRFLAWDLYIYAVFFEVYKFNLSITVAYLSPKCCPG